MENYPAEGSALLVINHLGDPDVVVVLASLPDFPEVIGKIETRDIRILRWVGDSMGVIWIHRGRPDRRALSAALTAFKEGRRVLIAPEGRESLTGGLETGTHGATFLASRGAVPIIPITLTGTENWRVYGHMKKLKRARISLTVGKPFHLPAQARGSDYLLHGTRQIMEALARQLPPEYRGVYSSEN
jgi:1-acyl-sn-glycerol-3-phosphate acyltransferase